MSFQNNVAIVTGASRGIGFAVANELARLGYSLGLIARTKTGIESASKEIQKQFPEVKMIYGAFDIADGIKVEEFVHQVSEKLGTVTVLVNNAGYYKQGTYSLPFDDVHRLIDTNYLAPVRFVNAVLPGMKKLGKGYIFNIASLAGIEAFSGIGNYCASKFALVGYSSSLAQELATSGIKVTVICPSWVNTSNAGDAPMKPDEMIQTGDLVLTIRYLLSLGKQACIREILIRC